MADTLSKTWTVIELIAQTQAYFKKCGITGARLDAEVLLAHCLGRDRVRLYIDFEYPLTQDELSRFRGMVRRRASREPAAYITGYKDFWSLRLAVGPSVLIPRPDTEVLVEQTVSSLGQQSAKAPARILDIGTGSGAIALALAHELPDASIVALDFSPEAIAVAGGNAAACGLAERVSFICGDGPGALPDGMPFDAVVSNPPYIPTADIETLEPEIKNFEPFMALDGGPDGLDFYRGWIPHLKRVLKKGGFAAFEIGDTQGPAVMGLFAAAGGYEDIRVVEDYARKPRVVCARRSS